MSFHSLDYLLFLPLVMAIYFAVPHRVRWVVLMVASNLFYMSWRVDFAVLLWFTTLVDYGVARAMPRYEGRTRKLLLTISLVSNLGLLFFFKYFALAANTVLDVWHAGQFQPIHILLPLGISFYTFQTLGYVIDVYRGKREPERHLGYFSVYIMYFPQLVAGPIERPGHFLPQLRERHVFDVRRAALGGSLILVGYFKKLVIADRLAQFVPIVMADPTAFSPGIVTATSFGSIYQYYADLSGYADIAVGSSLIFGIRLAQNFNRPFAAVSISQFWQRWHITVTTWFRDYVYLPIARGARGRGRKSAATMLTIVIISFWHGASWTWLFTGVLAGALMVAEGEVRRSRRLLAGAGAALGRIGIGSTGAERVGRNLNRLLLWLFLLLLGSLVNAPDWRSGMQMWVQMAAWPAELLRGEINFEGAGTLNGSILILPFAILALEIYQWLDSRKPVFERLAGRGRTISWSFHYALAAIIIMLGAHGRPDFIYFNF
jgi:D-alanyl-lipoteichoic acid acyltransferase DltB (MBOAT superfamily)